MKKLERKRRRLVQQQQRLERGEHWFVHPPPRTKQSLAHGPLGALTQPASSPVPVHHFHSMLRTSAPLRCLTAELIRDTPQDSSTDDGKL